MLNIGLLMTYNEEDIIAEVMENNQKFFDVIYVLDGSSDRTPEIIQRFKNVKYFLRDEDLVPKRRVRDGARQFLMEKAQEDYGKEGWFTLLHGDEILVDDPNEVALRAQKAGADKVNWHALNFFLHRSQMGIKFTTQKTIQEQVIYYHPGNLEIRQFRNKPGIFYDLNQICNVTPQGIGWKALLDYPILKHYVVRSPEQKRKKPSTGLAEIRDKGKDRIVPDEEIFVEKLHPSYKQVRRYDGSFHELAPGQRPSFLRQWLAWRKYRDVDLGVFGLLYPTQHAKYRKKFFKSR